MDLIELIAQAKENIRTAIADYGRHTETQRVLKDVSTDFIDRLAEDSVKAKQKLRELFSQSPVWNPKLDALVINGTRTADPDYDAIYSLGVTILNPAVKAGRIAAYDAVTIVGFFSRPDSEQTKQEAIEIMERVSPKAYAPGKKPSRIFKAVCKSLEVADETAGSEFQKLYAQFADELSARKIGYKLYASINPAHFITMSNPKEDERGTTLTSCHSFNSTEYEYNNGCTGYARDETSFIVFTASDPSNPETLNNRKTSRQIFAYEPGNGLLMQSRFYNTSGGTRGAVEESDLYRDLIQREISFLEEKPNLWKTYPYCGKEMEYCVEEGDGFGGYADWTYTDFNGKVSIRTDKKDDFHPIRVGTWGICVNCACENSDGVYCDSCNPGSNYCEYCDSNCHEETTTAYDRGSNPIEVCDDCLDHHFTRCERCDSWVHNDNALYVEDVGGYYCRACVDEYCGVCDCCDSIYHRENIYEAHDRDGDEIYICRDCLDNDYHCCEECGELIENRLNICPCCDHGQYENEEE